MAAQILDGKAISAELRGAIAQRVARLRENGVTPGLAVILVGRRPRQPDLCAQQERRV